MGKPEFQSEQHKGLMSLYIGEAYLMQIGSPSSSLETSSALGPCRHGGSCQGPSRGRCEVAQKWVQNAPTTTRAPW